MVNTISFLIIACLVHSIVSGVCIMYLMTKQSRQLEDKLQKVINHQSAIASSMASYEDKLKLAYESFVDFRNASMSIGILTLHSQRAMVTDLSAKHIRREEYENAKVCQDILDALNKILNIKYENG